VNPIKVSVGPLVTAAANNICTSQTPGAAGALTLNGTLVSGGVATLDTPRQILVTTVSNESGKTLVIVGTNWAGDPITETMTGPNATTGTSVLDYKTVTSITVSAAFTGAVTVGTTTTAGSAWIRMDSWALPSTTIQCTVTGTANYTVQQTMDNPNDPTAPVAVASMTWTSISDANLVAASATKAGTITATPNWLRVYLNSGSGSVVMTVAQAGVVGL